MMRPDTKDAKDQGPSQLQATRLAVTNKAARPIHSSTKMYFYIQLLFCSFSPPIAP
jgi:hypothetical protein